MAHPAAPHDNSTSEKPNVMGIPLARWAVISVSAIVVLYTAGSYSVKLYSDWMRAHMDESSYSNAVTSEMKAHDKDVGAQAVLFTDKDGPTVATYFSDGCIAISRPGPKLPYLPQGQSRVEWSLAPSRRPSSTAPDTPTPVWHSAGRIPIRPDETVVEAPATLAVDLDREDRRLVHHALTSYPPIASLQIA